MRNTVVIYSQAPGSAASLRPMTHAPETGAINRRQLSGADFWRVCHAKPVPILSGTRFRRRLERCSIRSRFLAWNVICDWSLDSFTFLSAVGPGQIEPSCKLVKHTLTCQWQNILSYDTLLLLAFSHLRYIYIMSQKNLNELFWPEFIVNFFTLNIKH